MAAGYVRSTDGSNADSGLSWALAKATVAGAISAGLDPIYVSQAHSESTAGSITFSGGSISAPIRIICVDDSAEPPTTLASTAVVANTTAAQFAWAGHMFWSGITFQTANNFWFANNATVVNRFDNCKFISTGTSTWFLNANSGGMPIVEMNNCTLKFGSSASSISTAPCYLRMTGCSFDAATSSPTDALFFGASSHSARVVLEGCDLSNLSSSFRLTYYSPTQLTLRNCKMPTSWSATLNNASPATAGSRIEITNCDSADTNYRLIYADALGVTTQETTIVRASGASDGTTALSWKMTGNANTNATLGRLYSPEIVQWVDSTGSSKTATIEIIHDSTTALKDSEVWLELQYQGTSGRPLTLLLTDAAGATTSYPHDPLATAADQTSSSATWTTTGLTDPNKQKLAVTFTPQEKGYLHARVVLAKASKTIYVDPLLTVA